MANAYISINQLAEFSAGTNSTKNRIIKQQMTPNRLLIPWYQSAKGSIKKYLKNVNDLTPLEEGLEKLRSKMPHTNRAKTDREVSIVAIEKLMQLNIQKLLKDIPYEIIKPEEKKINIRGVDISTSPEIIIKAQINGKTIYGGIKIHICKTKPFDNHQCQLVSAVLYEYIRKKICKKGEEAIPNLCLCIDIFGGRIVGTEKNNTPQLREINEICDEIQSIWSTLNK